MLVLTWMSLACAAGIFSRKCSCPTRVVRGAATPLATPGGGVAPRPRFDVSACRTLGAHALGLNRTGSNKLVFLTDHKHVPMHVFGVNIKCRESGGRLAHPAGSARGSARSQF